MSGPTPEKIRASGPAPGGMEWSIESHREPKHVRVTLTGHLRVDLLPDVWADIFKNKYWRKDSPIVFDLGAVQVADLNLDAIGAMVAMLQDIRGEFPGGRLLIIAGSTLQFGKTRQYQALAELRKGRRVDIFRNEEQALKSLLIPY